MGAGRLASRRREFAGRGTGEFDRRAALCRHEPGQGPGIFFRRPGRGTTEPVGSATATESNRSFEQNLYFLPGGHVDYNEPSAKALARELLEEMNLSSERTEFKGILECSWDRKGTIYHELNLVFQVYIKNLRLENPPIALDHGFQKFIWYPIAKLEELTILPGELKPIIYSALKDTEQLPFYSQMIKNI